jgi:hypothetical protein
LKVPHPGRQLKHELYKKRPISSSVNQEIYGHGPGRARDVTDEYILWLTDKYTFIFLDTDEYNDIYSSALYSEKYNYIRRLLSRNIITFLGY